MRQGAGALRADIVHPRARGSQDGDDSASLPVSRQSTFSRLAEAKLAPLKRRTKEKCRQLVEDKNFAIVTTVLTLYALFGDDIRLSGTHKEVDIVFNVFTLLCLLLFTFEIVITSIGKDEYFGGFFFYLDLISTASLIFDLTWIAEELFGRKESDSGGDSSQAQQLRAGRASRAGARAGRVVRIIRLVRLVKLYRHAMEHKAKRERQEKGAKVSPGNDANEDDMQDDDEPNEHEKTESDGKPESRVGKKLSGMTTRRVIILVLVMLFALPQFESEIYGTDFTSSAQFGADMIYRRWSKWCRVASEVTGKSCLEAEKGTDIVSNADEYHHRRLAYEKALTLYIYYHRYYSEFGNPDCVIEDGRDACSDYMWHFFWVGVQSSKLKSDEKTMMLAKVWSNVTIQNDDFDSSWRLPSGILPWDVKLKLAGPWQEKCLGGNYVGMSVLSSADPERHCPNDMRYQEVEYILPSTMSDDEVKHFSFMFAFDKRKMVRWEASLNMLQTIFICIVLGFGALFFAKDSNALLLTPIERMIAKMEKIRDDPLAAVRLGDEEYKREVANARKRKEEMERKRHCWQRKPVIIKEPMETVVLEKTIIKLGGLLALGFGEAGAEIIGQNMKGSDTVGVNAMIPGQKVDAIFGFTDIRNFTYVTEILRDQVMLFVNLVAEIVHGCVDDFHGACNKNAGRAFMLVWRLSGLEWKRQRKLGDMAVVAFMKIVSEINKSPVLAEYRTHPGLLQRMHGHFRVRMGFGLHCGWAIEGAIGSEFKIDASYLSPNVNMASRIEAATKQFDISILISHWLMELCSPDMMNQCRLIDNVTVKGSKQPMRLYCIDLDFLCLEVENKCNLRNVVKNRFKVRQLRESQRNAKWSDDYKVMELFKTDNDIQRMRRRYTEEFFERFDMAYRNYEAGEWLVAKDMLLSTQYFLPSSSMPGEREEDGPSTTLLSFMREFDYVAPAGWPGYRELTEK